MYALKTNLLIMIIAKMNSKSLNQMFHWLNQMFSRTECRSSEHRSHEKLLLLSSARHRTSQNSNKSSNRVLQVQRLTKWIYCHLKKLIRRKRTFIWHTWLSLSIFFMMFSSNLVLVTGKSVSVIPPSLTTDQQDDNSFPVNERHPDKPVDPFQMQHDQPDKPVDPFQMQHDQPVDTSEEIGIPMSLGLAGSPFSSEDQEDNTWW